MKIVVTEKAIRELIRETMMNPSVGWQSTAELSDSPASVSAVVDPSAAVIDPGNPNFKPTNRNELRAAISDMVNSISDDCAEQIFDAMKSAIEKTQEDKDMKTDKKVEETIRLAIRKIISEVRPKFKDIPVGPVTNPLGITPTRYPAGMSGGEATKAFEKRKSNLAKSFEKMDADADAAEMARSDKPAAGRTRKNVSGEEGFKDIGQKLGVSTSMAKKDEMSFMNKLKKFSGMESEDFEIMLMTAANDYVDHLKSSGELTSADVELMKDHPDIVTDLDGFREFFQKYVKREMSAEED